MTNDRKTSAVNAIAGFRRKIALLLTLRHFLMSTTVWCFAWGVLVLVLRAVAGVPSKTLLWGAIGCLFAIAAAVFAARRRLPSQTSVRALLDQQNDCGGLLMAEENTELGDWRSRIHDIRPPRLRWRNMRTWGLFALSLAFVIISLIVPVRFAAISSGRSLDVGREVNDLAEKITVLKEERIIDEARADALEQKLDQLGSEASGEDPAVTWEALDHLSDAVGKAAKEAAQAASMNQDKLDRAETLAEGLMAGAHQMDSKLMTESMQTLAEMMKGAMQENQILVNNLSPELQEAIKSGRLKPEQLKDLARAISQNKSALDQRLSKLDRVGIIDAKSLKSRVSANRRDNSGLAQFLKDNAERMSVEDAVGAWCENPGRGGVSRGHGDAAMTWTDGSSEKDARFKEKILPPSAVAGLQDSELVGLSAGAPKVENNMAAHGALNNAASGGGSAYTQTILPRHKGAVKRYFERK